MKGGGELRKTQTLRDRIYQELKKAIINLEIKPGDRIAEGCQASKLSVSRTPVRHALALLEKDGFVEKLPEGGYCVRRLTLREIRALFEVRLILEPEATRLAASRASEEDLKGLDRYLVRASSAQEELDEFIAVGRDLHTAIAKLTGNEVLHGIIRSLTDQLNVLAYFGMNMVLRSEQVEEEHATIVRLLQARNAEAAAQAARDHVMRACDAVVNALIARGDLRV